jgi:hypothetical protein
MIKSWFFHYKTSNKVRMLTLTTTIQHNTYNSSYCNKARKWNKRHIDQKGWNTSVLIDRWHDCLYRKSKGIGKMTPIPDKWVKNQLT